MTMKTDKTRGAFAPVGQTSVSKQGGAPPVYRPQQAVSQLKPQQGGALAVRPAAPPVYRSQPLVSPAMRSAPPVYRPQPLALQGKMPAPPFPQPARSPAVFHPQQRGVLQRFRSGGTIQRVRIWYAQTAIDLILREQDAAKKKFRAIMEDLHGGNLRAFIAIGKTNDAGDPEYWSADIAGSGGGGRGNYRLHITRKEDGFEVHLFEHAGGGRKGGKHVSVDGGSALSEADSTVLANTVWTPPPVTATPVVVPTPKATPAKKTPVGGAKKRIGDNWAPSSDLDAYTF
jgi:hypothetical protein